MKFSQFQIHDLATDEIYTDRELALNNIDFCVPAPRHFHAPRKLLWQVSFPLSFIIYLEIVLSIKSTNQKHGGFDVTVSLFSWGHPLTTAHA